MSFEVKIPSLGESVTEAVIGTWMRKDGDAVAKDEPILELESDKANMELVAEAAGVLHVLRAEGDTVAVGDVVATIDESAAKPAAKGEPPEAKPAAPEVKPESPVAAAAPTAARTPSPEAPSPRAPAPDRPTSPAVRRIAEEEGLNLSAVRGTGPKGRVTKGDALDLAAQKRGATAATPLRSAAAPTPPAAAAPARAEATADAEGERRVPMTRLRQVIARRLVEAQHVAAILTTFNEVDMTAVQALRKQYKDDFKAKHGIGLGYMSFFVKACCAAAAEVPALNAEIDETDIVYHPRVHMGVAVGTDRGLVVPVVRDADRRSFADIEREIARLADLARDNRLAIDDLSGATFTISNGGIYGSLLSTPILTPPQSGILGMHKIEKRPVVIDDEIQIRPMMYLALSYDHRIVDGQGAVTFLVRVKAALEDPARLLLDL